MSDSIHKSEESSVSSVTIKDVARYAGVSIATVSRIINNHPSVKERNRIKVLRVIKQLGYKPNVFAQKLAGGRLNVVGLIIPGYEGVFYSFYAQELTRNVGLGLETLKKDLFLHIYWGRDNFNSSYVEGVLFADVIGNESQLQRIIEEQVPCVVINKKVDNYKISYIAIDNEKGAKEACEFLIELGHKRIAHITGDMNTQCAQERLSGFKKALSKSKITMPDYFVQEGNFSRAQARRAIDSLLNKYIKPTAIFCASDDMAYEAILYLLERKMKVPSDISVVGFDNNPQYLYGPVALTTVHQPLDELVRNGLKMLQEQIQGTNKMVIRKVLPTRLIVGESTSYPPTP